MSVQSVRFNLGSLPDLLSEEQRLEDQFINAFDELKAIDARKPLDQVSYKRVAKVIHAIHVRLQTLRAEIKALKQTHQTK